MSAPYLKEAALLEDVADELIQVHQTLVVPDVMREDRQHHGVLWRTQRIGKKGKNRKRSTQRKYQREERENKKRAFCGKREMGVCFLERKSDEEKS